ncbi:hypothetical protein CsSME_00016293 [Camellia sinensis var. sinensis]
MPPTASYWCYRCSQFVRVSADDDNVVCPYCDGGFVESMDAAPAPESRRSFPPAAMYVFSNNSHRNSNLGFRRPRRSHRDRSAFNPVILYYDDGAGSGLRPLPATMSEFLMGSGFDRLLDQLTQIEINGLGRREQAPASKSAIESMPTIEIVAGHVSSESHCAVCKEAFVLGSEAREMPCKHIYHSDCILPWLSLRNSCPVCRHELPSDAWVGFQGEEEQVRETFQLCIQKWMVDSIIVVVVRGGLCGGRGEADRERALVVVGWVGLFAICSRFLGG